MQTADDMPDNVLDLPPIDEVFKVDGDEEDRPGSSQLPQTPEEQMQLFTQASSLAYPLGDPAYIIFLFEHSSALRQNIDAYCVNIHGFGDRLEPVIDLESEDADDKVRDLLWLRAVDTAEEQEGTVEPPVPGDAEVEAEKKRLQTAMRLEKLRIEQFLSQCCLDRSFTQLRMETCQDLELLGNAYWEVERNDRGRIMGFNLIPAFTIRLMPKDQEPRPIVIKMRRGVDITTQAVKKHYSRRFVQVVNNAQRYFKEFGDERTISAKRGTYHKDVDALLAADPTGEPAAELIHFAIHSSRSPYGIPRWIGTMLTLIGLREEEETNRDYWENKSVPPLAITATGVRLQDGAAQRIESAIGNRTKGKKNFHKALVIEGSPILGPDGKQARAEIKFWPLMDAQLKEALHQGYDLRCTDKTGQTFRMPRPLRGDIQDVNRAAYEAALEFAELQVFGPERQRFDDFINRVLFVAMGFSLWTYVSKGPMPRDSAAVADLIVKMAGAGLTFNQAFAMMSDVFNKPVPEIEEPWADLPINLVLKAPDWRIFTPEGIPEPEPAEEQPGGEVGPGAPAAPEEEEEPEGEEGKEGGVEKAVVEKVLLRLRDEFASRESEAATETFAGE